MGWIPIILYVKHVSYFVYLSGYFFFAMNYWILAIGEIDNVVYLTERGSVTRLLEVRFDKTAESIWHITWYNLLSWAAELCYCWHKNVTVEWETWRPYTCTTTTTPHGQFPVNLLTIHTHGNWHLLYIHIQSDSHQCFLCPHFQSQLQKCVPLLHRHKLGHKTGIILI